MLVCASRHNATAQHLSLQGQILLPIDGLELACFRVPIIPNPPAPSAHPQVMRRAHWDDEREVWVLERLSDMGKRDSNVLKRPVSASGQRRPTSDFAKLATAMGDMNPRCVWWPAKHAGLAAFSPASWMEAQACEVEHCTVQKPAMQRIQHVYS